MKKIIASVVFFGSFGVAFAQIGGGGSWDPSAMKSYYIKIMDQYYRPIEQCVTQYMSMPRVVRENCESVWNHSADGTSKPKDGEEYVPPFSLTHDSDFVARNYTKFLNDHKNDDLVRPNCNKYKSSAGMCNNQMIRVKQSSGFFGLFRGSSFGSQAVQGCRYYQTLVNERKAVTTCPQPKPVEDGACNASCNANYGKICCSTSEGIKRWDGYANKSEGKCMSIEEAKKATGDGRSGGLSEDGLSCVFYAP